MEAFIIALLIGAVLVWNFVMRPRSAVFRSGPATFRIVDGHLEIAHRSSYVETIGSDAGKRVPYTKDWRCPVGNVFYSARRDHNVVDVHRPATSQTTHSGVIVGGVVVSGSSHTVHSPGGSWKEKGSAYHEVWFAGLDQSAANERLLMTTLPLMGLGDGSKVASYCRNSGWAAYKFEPGVFGRLALFSWLRRNGMSGEPDESQAEAHFHAETSAILAAYRARFGFVEGDIDHVRFDKNLVPISYLLLDKDDVLTAHYASSDVTNKRPIGDFKVSGSMFHRSHRVQEVYVASDDPSIKGGSVVLSKPIWARLSPILTARKEQIRYWDM